ncbi:MAG: DUF5668 domain-containing protein [Chloroflexota bacterium]
MSEMKPVSSRRSIFWPLMLIIIGVVLLLNTLGALPGDVWATLLRLWPLLFLIGGLDHILRGEGWVWGIFSIGLGTVFLLSNFGYLPGNALNMLLRLWPLFLIAVGLDLILRGSSRWVTGVAVLITIAVVGGVVWLAAASQGLMGGVAVPISQPLQGAERAIVRLSNPVGGLTVGGSAAAGMLAEGQAVLARRTALEDRYAVQGGTGSFSLGTSGTAYLPWGGSFQSPTWQLKLNGEVPITLETNTGVGDQMLDLNGLDVERLNASVAVGELTVRLSAEDAFEGTISNPIGSLTVEVPRGALVEIQVETAITARNISASDFRAEGDYFYSPGANAQNAQIRLKVEQPIGVLTLRLVP